MPLIAIPRPGLIAREQLPTDQLRIGLQQPEPVAVPVLGEDVRANTAPRPCGNQWAASASKALRKSAWRLGILKSFDCMPGDGIEAVAACREVA
jgi:hypothetical protein